MKVSMIQAGLAKHIDERAMTTSSTCEDAIQPTREGCRAALAQVERTVDALRKRAGCLPAGSPALSTLEANIEKLEALRERKLAALRQNVEGHVPFHSHTPGDSLTDERSRELSRDVKDHYFSDLDGQRTALHGEYAFVVPFDEPGTIRVGESHHQLARGKPVSYAGTCWFDSESRLTKWQNLTGHYKTHPAFIDQTECARDSRGLLLPRDRFRARHIDALRVADLGKRYWDNTGSLEATAQEIGVSPDDLEPVLRTLGIL
ncbi:MAG: hypothetical protein VX699_00665 [Myxococcota bacterium]|nr:hypothetical protein [Myxococcota bacterium]